MNPKPAVSTYPSVAYRAILSAVLISTPNLMAAPPPGQLLASMCFQCHGTNGQAVGGFESIAGKSSREIYGELLEMSKRPPEGIMDLQARAYTPNQILQIANYLATLPKGANSDD